MARPKLGETETERMQLKITTAEIRAIDDWRFSNRVPSRSEAVRRLCQIALEADQTSKQIASEAEAFLKTLESEFDKKRLLPLNVGKVLSDNFEAITSILLKVVNMRNLLGLLATRDDVEDTISRLTAFREKVEKAAKQSNPEDSK